MEKIAKIGISTFPNNYIIYCVYSMLYYYIDCDIPLKSIFKRLMPIIVSILI